MERILDRLRHRLPDYDPDYDGRPSVLYGFVGDPLLDALIRAHPERIPAEMVASLRAHLLRWYDPD